MASLTDCSNRYSGGLIDPTGELDSTLRINSAIGSLQNGGVVYLPPGIFKITGTVALASGVTLRGSGRGVTVIRCDDGDITHVMMRAVTNASVCDLTLDVTRSGTTAYIGGVMIDGGSRYCRVENVDVKGVSWAGVFIQTSSQNVISRCHFSSFRGAVFDSADICIYRTSQYNKVLDNDCEGGNWHGVLIQDPGGGSLPSNNIVRGNHVGAHTSYGICIYNISPANTFPMIEGNYVEGITGENLRGVTGAGIYIKAAGGAQVVGNTVRNCCRASTTLTLAPAGIGINGIEVGLVPPNISGNTVAEMARFFGIYVVSSPGGANISGNTVSVPAAASGSDGGIFITNASNVSVQGNLVVVPDTVMARGIGVFANRSAINAITVVANTVQGSNYAGIDFFQSGDVPITGAVVNNNVCMGTGPRGIAMRLEKIDRGVVNGNYLNAQALDALTLANCTVTRLSNNVLISGGVNGATFLGKNSGSYYDKSNTAVGFVSNKGLGLIKEAFGHSTNNAGYAAVGDRIEQTVPAIGSPRGWRCTVAGNPGTWVSEGNL